MTLPESTVHTASQRYKIDKNYQHFIEFRIIYPNITSSSTTRMQQQELSDNTLPLPVEFFTAVSNNNTEEVCAFLSKNYNMNSPNLSHGTGPSTALATAAHNGHRDMAELLTSSGCDVNAYDVTDMKTSLMYASSSGHGDVMKFLLENGANVNALDKGNRSAIYYAAGNGKLEATLILLRHNAQICSEKPDQAEQEEKEVMSAASKKRRHSSGDFLGGKSAFLKACSKNNVTIVKELLKHDVTVLNSLNHDGECVLHIAARSGFTELIKVLLHHKSLLDQRNNAGETSLHVACRSLFTDVHQAVTEVENIAKCAEKLIKAGCDVTAKDTNGHIALHALLMGKFLLRGPDSRLGRLRFRLVQLILSSARSISLSDLPHPNELSTDLTEEHADIFQWLHSFLRTPRSLQHMCRVTVRQAVGNTRMHRIEEELPLAPNLARYIALV